MGDLIRLPSLARVAFASRCARRVLPLFRRTRPEDGRPLIAIKSAEAVSCAEVPAADLRCAAEAAAKAALESQSDLAASYAAQAAAAAARAATFDGQIAESQCDDFACYAVAEALAGADYDDLLAELSLLQEAVREDFSALVKLGEREGWTDHTPMRTAVLGPLWPGRKPGWCEPSSHSTRQ